MEKIVAVVSATFQVEGFEDKWDSRRETHYTEDRSYLDERTFYIPAIADQDDNILNEEEVIKELYRIAEQEDGDLVSYEIIEIDIE